jgi:hypothetical protein
MTPEEVQEAFANANGVINRLLLDWKEHNFTREQIFEKIWEATQLPNGITMTCFVYAVMAKRLMEPPKVEANILPAIRQACVPLLNVLEMVYADHFAMTPPRCRHCEQAISEVLKEHRELYGDK